MKTTRPADFTDVRATNLSVVLHHLRANGPSSRASIAASTGLNKATVSSLTGSLIEQRLLRETGLTGNRIGRPGTALALDGSAYAAIGLQVAADRLTALAVDFSGEQLLLWHRAFDGGPATTGSGRAVSAITALAQRAATRVRQQGRHVLGVTVAVPGLVEEGGTVRLSPPLGWADVDLRGLLSGSLRQPGLDVAVANHAGLAAVAELRHSGGHDLTYVTGAAGIEAGIVVDGRLLHGSRGFTGQIGRFTLGPAGSPTLADLAGVEPLVRRALPGFDPESLTDLAPAVEQVATLARFGDTAVLGALRDTGTHLGQGLALVANLVNPEVIVLGDHYAALAEWLIPAAAAELSRNTLAPASGGTRLVASGLGLHAAALGGAVTHLNRVDTGTLPTTR
ncbi:ROK family protein [Actinoplanes derwentensis]|uniref:Sugar kinase of the NBD/HSP70 family, may contain an N-terminal HTH domain n=1 Tax=Actinoplanes derwentensis TaxID=113562 RepID=A0A1H2CF72_9ACTN|nr:ROK family protein [Actinoplanes derwentensis]GID86064.1 xylose repressor [Actinoplanes derwentensis]SDT69004.1 Sugar kinase of the NBD/HSP70 family, may contain an N-terminal HTH domain [Actinoplanes derwentensis]